MQTTALKVRIITFLTILITSSLGLNSCGNSEKSSSDISNNGQSEEKRDTTITGTISNMWWSKYQGLFAYGIGMNNGKFLSFKTGRGGQIDENGVAPFFVDINAEVKDIVNIEKEKDRDKLNLKYLNKNISVTYDLLTHDIIKMNLLGGEQPVSFEPKTIEGYITDLKKEKRISANYIVLKDDSGKVENLRLYVDPESRYTVKSIFNGYGNKQDYVFYTKHYALALTPGNTDRKVKVTCSMKLVLDKESAIDDVEKESLYFQNVVTDIDWADVQNSSDL